MDSVGWPAKDVRRNGDGGRDRCHGLRPEVDVKEKLLPLATKAWAALLAGDKPTAIQTLTAIRDTVQPSITQGPWYDIYRDSRVPLALLTQPVPAT
jgi:hypothetical protein